MTEYSGESLVETSTASSRLPLALLCADLMLFMAYSVAVNHDQLTLMQMTRSATPISIKTALIALLCSCLICACGLRGPLYLPEEGTSTPPATEQNVKSAEDEASGEDEDEKKEDGKDDSEKN